MSKRAASGLTAESGEPLTKKPLPDGDAMKKKLVEVTQATSRFKEEARIRAEQEREANEAQKKAKHDASQPQYLQLHNAISDAFSKWETHDFEFSRRLADFKVMHFWVRHVLTEWRASGFTAFIEFVGDYQKKEKLPDTWCDDEEIYAEKANGTSLKYARLIVQRSGPN